MNQPNIKTSPPAMPQQVVIYEPNPDGHRFKYVQYLIESASSSYINIHVVTSDRGASSREYDLHLEPLVQSFTLHALSDPSYKKLSAFTQKIQADRTIVPDGDNLIWNTLWFKGWRGRGVLCILVMRATGQGANPVKRWVATSIKSFKKFMAARKTRIEIHELKSSLWAPNGRESGVPDPITYCPDAISLNCIWPLPERHPDLKWIGVVGAITKRKNVPLIMEAFNKMPDTNSGLVIAGKIESSLVHSIQSAAERLRAQGRHVIILDELLSDGQLDAIINNLHAVVLAHSNEGPSGILGKAVESGTYVIAAGAKSLKKDCERIPQTSRWTELSSIGIAESIASVLDADDIPTAKRLHTMERFTARLLGGGYTRRDTAC